MQLLFLVLRLGFFFFPASFSQAAGTGSGRRAVIGLQPSLHAGSNLLMQMELPELRPPGEIAGGGSLLDDTKALSFIFSNNYSTFKKLDTLAGEDIAKETVLKSHREDQCFLQQDPGEMRAPEEDQSHWEEVS